MLALKIFLAKLMPQYRVVQSAKSNMGTLKVIYLQNGMEKSDNSLFSCQLLDCLR